MKKKYLYLSVSQAKRYLEWCEEFYGIEVMKPVEITKEELDEKNKEFEKAEDLLKDRG